MRFYTMQHTCYCGIDLHVDWMSLCVLDADGEGRVHQHMRTDPQVFREALKPFHEDVVVCVACLFTWDLAGRSLRRCRDALRPGPGPLYAGDVRRQSQERSHRCPPNRGAAAWETPSPGLR
jgi:hypothetical protein